MATRLLITCALGLLASAFVYAVRYDDTTVTSHSLHPIDVARRQEELANRLGSLRRIGEIRGLVVRQLRQKYMTLLQAVEEFRPEVRQHCEFSHFPFEPGYDDASMAGYLLDELEEDLLASGTAEELAYLDRLRDQWMALQAQ